MSTFSLRSVADGELLQVHVERLRAGLDRLVERGARPGDGVALVAHLGGDGERDGGFETLARSRVHRRSPTGRTPARRWRSSACRRSIVAPQSAAAAAGVDGAGGAPEPAVVSAGAGGAGGGVGGVGGVVVAAAGGEDEGADGQHRDEPAAESAGRRGRTGCGRVDGASHEDLLGVVVHAGRKLPRRRAAAVRCSIGREAG